MENVSSNNSAQYCIYYQAHVQKTESWFVVAVLKSFDHMSFDRTLDIQASIFEFFVPVAMETDFIQIISYLQKRGFVTNIRKLPNRLCDPLSVV